MFQALARRTDTDVWREEIDLRIGGHEWLISASSSKTRICSTWAAHWKEFLHDGFPLGRHDGGLGTCTQQWTWSKSETIRLYHPRRAQCFDYRLQVIQTCQSPLTSLPESSFRFFYRRNHPRSIRSVAQILKETKKAFLSSSVCCL